MIEVGYAASFLRQFKKLPKALQQEAKEKIELFKSSATHESLKVHKLRGAFAGEYSFSVNFRYRIIFEWIGDERVILLLIGNHKIYDL